MRLKIFWGRTEIRGPQSCLLVKRNNKGFSLIFKSFQYHKISDHKIQGPQNFGTGPIYVLRVRKRTALFDQHD